MNQYIMVVTTTDSHSLAKELASILLSQKVAACVQIEKIESMYHWEGNVCCDEEFKVSIKTKASHYEAVEALIQNNHTYDTPQIVLFEIAGGSKEYLKWVEELTP